MNVQTKRCDLPACHKEYKSSDPDFYLFGVLENPDGDICTECFTLLGIVKP